MGLSVLQPGLKTTIQDRGRFGYREFGVPVGGAFDAASFDLANALIGNDLDAAALEFTQAGGRYRAETPLALALAGAPFEACVQTVVGSFRRLTIPQTFVLDPADQLIIGGTPRGCRCYLAVKGGWGTPIMLGSRSSEIALTTGTTIPAEAGRIATRRPISWSCPDPTDGPIRLLDGPDGPVPIELLQAPYGVAVASDRVGLRLTGPRPEGVDAPARTSAPVAPGALQISGEGVLILGIAGGTMGGYPHVAHVISADLDRLAQARPGVVLRFVRIESAEARRIDRDRRTQGNSYRRIIRLGASS